MNKNSINVSIPSKDLEELQSMLESFSSKVSPFLLEKSTTEIFAGLLRIGEKSEGFVSKALQHAKKESNLIPGYSSLEDAQKDFQLYLDLKSLEDVLEKLLMKVSQTRILAGAEALDFACDFYKYTSVYAKAKDPVAMVVFEDLKPRFVKTRLKKLKTEEN